MFTVDKVISNHYPKLRKYKPVYSTAHSFLRWLLQEEVFIAFGKQYPHVNGIEFVEQVLNFFNFSFTSSNTDRENIPVSGRVMIIANHPIGSLDGLALFQLIHEIRTDVKIIANEMLMYLQPLQSCLLPVGIMGKKPSRTHISAINQALTEEKAVIVFPSGEVSRLKPQGIRDSKWHNGFLKIALRAKAPILPILISGRNSMFFYGLSSIYKPFSTAMLIQEMFKQRNNQIRFQVGEIIPYKSYRGLNLPQKKLVKQFHKHLYQIGSKRKNIFATQSAIASPEKPSDLKKDLKTGECLGKTPDNKLIYLYEKNESSPVIREIGRLREIAFRAVDEGSGKRRDLDKFDKYYHHLVLWDGDELEISGAYRFADTGKIIKEKGIAGLYSGTLFKLDMDNSWFLQQGLELGRSFIQPKYWKKRGLEYLWYGIGAYLARNPQYQYLFGPVSISNSMPQYGKELLIYFYLLYFGQKDSHIHPYNPFHFNCSLPELEKNFTGNDYRQDYKKLKTLLGEMDASVPPLYKQYSELCEPGGGVFLDFNIDPNFNSCIDGLIIVDIKMIKARKRNRYMRDYEIKTLDKLEKIHLPPELPTIAAQAQS